jgi:2-oxoglutarate dehydrogenase E2 component (dihydrolipoamide succinyltransferase)
VSHPIGASAGVRQLTPVLMPQLGETVSEGTVTRWLKAPGDPVALGEPLFEVSTDKVDTEIESPASGFLVDILVDEDATVDVGTLLANIANTGYDSGVDDLTSTARTGIAGAPVAPAGPPAAVGRRHRFSPRVRRLARDNGVTLERVIGTGVAGRVTPSDVVRAGELGSTAPPPIAAYAVPPVAPPRPATASSGTLVVEVGVSSAGEPELPARIALAALAADRIERPGRAGTDLGVLVDEQQVRRMHHLPNAAGLNLAAAARTLRDRAALPMGLGSANLAILDCAASGALYEVVALEPGTDAVLAIGTVIRRPAVVSGAPGEMLIAVRAFVHLALTYDAASLPPAAAARILGAVRTALSAG